MYSLIFFAPVFIFFILTVLGGRLGGYFTALAVACSTFFSCVLCFDALYSMIFHSFFLSYYLPLFSIFETGWLSVEWHFYFDQLVIFMFSLITLVSFFIQLFSISYMGEDASHVRFMIYLCFFMIAMMLLVGAANFIQLFFGWELVGLASFLLINFWFSRQDANAAAFKAMAVNRVGDCFLLLSMLLFVYEYGSFEFDMIFCLVTSLTMWSHLSFFFLVIGAFAKSAQFFFHSWLPDAMEGPTPVSALLHSATMVTAGVFLVMRFMDLLEVFPVIRYIVVFFGLLTAFYAMSIAAVADDTKRVTAYTTLNQLGFMFFGCGSLAFSTVLFHLIVHGFYKSFSFLCAAIELHDFEDEQDGESDQPELAGRNSIYDVLTAVVFFSVNAIPFTSPSISKEFMLLSGMEKMPDYFTFLITLVLFSSFIDEGRDDVETDFSDATFYGDEQHIHSSVPPYMLAGCFGLGGLSIFSSAFLEELFLDVNLYSTGSSFFWLDTRGSILIALPFLSLLASDFDSANKPAFSEDFGKTTIWARTDSRYQAVLFNADLWYYDELVSRFSSNFYKFSYWQTNFVLDKGFFEQFYVNGPLSFFQAVQNLLGFVYSTTLERTLTVSLLITFFLYLFFFNVFFSTFFVFFIFSYFCSGCRSLSRKTPLSVLFLSKKTLN
jgi:NADH:ubiquinone oxidoreductase subunit 5 (subunit L)/multisubunit Na+/H+ antiporter MnhA subunit